MPEVHIEDPYVTVNGHDISEHPERAVILGFAAAGPLERVTS